MRKLRSDPSDGLDSSRFEDANQPPRGIERIGASIDQRARGQAREADLQVEVLAFDDGAVLSEGVAVPDLHPAPDAVGLLGAEVGDVGNERKRPVAG